ncbi:hypothetical protein [Bordetella sp. 2513F-2]
MTLPFNVLPGSDAASAVEAVRQLDLRSDMLDQQLAPILQRYNVDPVTTAAVGETARRITANNPNIALQPLAESLVGTAVADPRVAGNNARQAVLAGGSDLSRPEQEQLAIQAAGIEAEKAGADKAVAEAKAREALSQGASPEMAAQSAAAAAASAAVANNPSASGLEIFGYLKAMVQGVVIETNLSNERHEVTGNTDWIIRGAFVQNTAQTLEINCNEYHAQAQHDISRRSFAANIYLLGYYMTSPDPWTITGLSVSFSGATTAGYAKILSPGLIKTMKIKKDLYLSGITVGEAKDTFHRTHKVIDKALVTVRLKNKLLYLGGNPSMGSIPSKLKGIPAKLTSIVTRKP